LTVYAQATAESSHVVEASTSFTSLLVEARTADPRTVDAAFAVVYDELRRLAHSQLRRENAGHTLGTTALVHEAYIRLVDQTRVDWRNRAQFMALAAMAMRRILVDHARRHGAARRGGGMLRVPLEHVDLVAQGRAELLLALDAALARLATLDERLVRVVECRFFGGMTEADTAAALGVSLRTVKRDWARARSWLYQEIHPESAG
jgi:RNA polymerase sigma factor (TIGR02999 family)